MKKAIWILVMATACNNGVEHQNAIATGEGLKDTLVRVTEPQMKKEYYKDGAIFREINLETLEAKIYNGDGKLFLKGRFNDSTYQLNGVWEEWDKVENYKRFELSYINNIENGPFASFKKDGTVYARGFKKNNAFNDTLKFYDEEGKVFEMQVWKPEPAGKEGARLVKTINLNDRRSDGTIEKINGKTYRWEGGKRMPVDEGK